jgi:hypothetical protein
MGDDEREANRIEVLAQVDDGRLSVRTVPTCWTKQSGRCFDY